MTSLRHDDVIFGPEAQLFWICGVISLQKNITLVHDHGNLMDIGGPVHKAYNYYITLLISLISNDVLEKCYIRRECTKKWLIENLSIANGHNFRYGGAHYWSLIDYHWWATTIGIIIVLPSKLFKQDYIKIINFWWTRWRKCLLKNEFFR